MTNKNRCSTFIIESGSEGNEHIILITKAVTAAASVPFSSILIKVFWIIQI